jgi:K(+)-stimulated pyrophosphate-energized sodium pump
MVFEWAPVAGMVALLFAAYLAFSILKKSPGTPEMQRISAAIREGATAYLNRQYKTIGIIAVIIAILIAVLVNVPTAVGFVVGAVASAAAGYIGMNMSVRANSRTAEAAKRGLEEALTIAVRGGAITGMAIVGLGLLAVSALYYLYQEPILIIGAGFGASLISLFARVGGGIYTKAADVGADIVGKVEKGIPEDDPRNPAVIADNVGDNVGDCAGMGADLFETYVVTLIAAMLLGATALVGGAELGPNAILFPLLMGAAGIFASIFGVMVIRLGGKQNIWSALSIGVFVTLIISAVATAFLANALFGNVTLFHASLAGLFVTIAIWYITYYYTAKETKPVQDVAEASRTGAGTNVIAGLGLGMISTAMPMVVIVIAIFWAYSLAGVYGIAIATMAMLSVTAMIVTLDSYGPITDNAGGIAEMAKLPKDVRHITDSLDAVGNTTKAVTKGFAISSAALAALSLFAAYAAEASLTMISLLNPTVVIGLFIGGALPFIFSGLTMQSVGRAAYAIVNEVRRQFKEMPGIMKGTQKPDYAKAVDISTVSALREMIAPGMLAVLAPLVVGFMLGSAALAGLLAGAIISGFMMALFLANAGAAWDNAKKYIESGHLGGKGSDAHKAAVVGDTVGDPAKDTAGPALNALIKVLNTISIIFAGLFVTYSLI